MDRAESILSSAIVSGVLSIVELGGLITLRAHNLLQAMANVTGVGLVWDKRNCIITGTHNMGTRY